MCAQVDFLKTFPQGAPDAVSDHKAGLRKAGLFSDENSRLFVKKTIVVGNVSKLVSKVLFVNFLFWPSGKNVECQSADILS